VNDYSVVESCYPLGTVQDGWPHLYCDEPTDPQPFYAPSPISYIRRQIFIDGTAHITMDVTGPCGFSAHQEGDFEVFGFGDVHYLTTLPPGACPGTYHVTSTTDPHPDQVADVGTGDFEVLPGCPPAWFLGQFYGQNPSGTQSDPVNTLTGAYQTRVVDAQLPAAGVPFKFIRSYNSADTTSGPFGPGWHSSYDDYLTISQGGHSVVLHGGDGVQVGFEQQNGVYLADCAGMTAVLTKNADGTFSLQSPDQITRRFDASGLLNSITDRNGNRTLLTYTSGRLTQITDPAGRIVTLTYTNNLVSKIALPVSRSVTYGYTGGRLTTATDLRGKVWTYHYDPTGLLDNVKDPNLHDVVHNTYGSDGRVATQKDGRGFQGTFSWNASTQTSTYNDALGHAWIDRYQAGMLIQRTDPTGASTRYWYDERFNLVQLTDASSNQWKMTYDANGNKTSETDPDGHIATWTYTPKNDIDLYTDFRHNVTDYDYDAKGNLTKITQPGSTVTVFQPDPATGLTTSVTDPRNKVWLYGYDPAGNLTTTTTPLGNKTTYTYDPAGRKLTMVEARGNKAGANPVDFTWTYGYDDADHRTLVTDPLAHAVAWSYDPAGLLDTRKDQKLRVTDYNYDAANHLTDVIAPGNATTHYTYNEVGTLTGRTDAASHTWVYTPDTRNQLASSTSPMGRVWSYTYTPTGLALTETLPSGNATTTVGDDMMTYGYDDLDRLATINYSDSTPDVTIGYDENSNVKRMVDGSGTELYEFDPLNQLTKVTRGADVSTYTYDPAGNVLTRTLPGSNVIYTYNSDGAMKTVTDGTNVTTYGYDVAGNQLSRTLPAANGVVETNTYDKAGRLATVAVKKGTTTIASFTYSLDPVGLPFKVVSNSGTTSYKYEPNRDWLAEACSQASCTQATDPFIRYTYDAVGNRKTEVRPSGTTTYSYNADDKLTSAAAPTGTTSYTYDRNGNELTAGTATMTYDLQGRLATYSQGTGSLTYGYDGAGRRLTASTGTAATSLKYLWDEQPAVPMLSIERDGNGALLRRYDYGTELVSMRAGGQDSFFHHDGLGSVVNVTGPTGVKQWTYAYEPFGVTKAATPNGSPPANMMKFAGEYADPTSGLYHLRARDYDPTTGRFLQIDPARNPIRTPVISPYVYADNVPTAYVDPSGRDTISLCLDAFVINGCTGVSEQNEIGAYGSFGWNGTLGGGVEYSNADCFSQLGGPFAGASVSVGAVGGGVQFGVDQYGNPIVTGQVSGGIMVGLPASPTVSYTYVTSLSGSCTVYPPYK
jgi:RHS repeat-associated protein